VQSQTGHVSGSETEVLFVSLAEQLHNSFMQIARLSEANGISSKAQQGLVSDISHAAMQLTESYTLSVRLKNRQIEPELRPVMVTTVLHEAVHELSPLAKLLGVQLAITESTRGNLVVADPTILKAALTSLGQVFILSQSQQETNEPVKLGVHRSRYGVVAGLYSSTGQLSAQAFRRAHQLHAQALQPLPSLVSGPATGVFVAESLLASMSSKLHISRFQTMQGLAVTLPNCQQLLLV
jgi:hypothetical protein